MNTTETIQVPGDNERWEFRLTRRRYGRSQWYCWAEVNIGGEFFSLGDPWPQRTPPRSQLIEAAIATLANRRRECGIITTA